MADNTILTAARLREYLSYDPDTGVFRWLIDKTSRARVGQIAGTIQRMRPGYSRWRIFIDGFEYKANRLAWLYMTGEWPVGKVDHENTDPMDNRWVNLRIATSAQNQWNVGIRRNNTTGFAGVHYDKRRNKYRAELHLHLGRFDTPEAAHEAYKQALLRLRGSEFVHRSLRVYGTPIGQGAGQGQTGRLPAPIG